MEKMTARHLIGSKLLLRSEGANNVLSFQQLLDGVITDPTLLLGLSISRSDKKAIWLVNLIQANDLAFLSNDEVAIVEDVSVIKLALCSLICCGGSVPLKLDDEKFEIWLMILDILAMYRIESHAALACFTIFDATTSGMKFMMMKPGPKLQNSLTGTPAVSTA